MDPAAPHMKRAIRTRSQFRHGLRRSWNRLKQYGNASAAKIYLQKSYDLRDRASEHEKFYIMGHYYGILTGDIEKAIGLFQEWHQTYPQDDCPWPTLLFSASCLATRRER